MNKIIKSVAIIAFVAAIAVGATSAYFSDEEKSTGNTFTAGTIDIAIDGENPWTKNYNIGDLKPGETGYINFDISNVGQNPVNVSKNLSKFVANGGATTYNCGDVGMVSSEPECVRELALGHRVDDVQTQLIYDLSVEVYNAQGVKIWWQEIYSAGQGKSLTDVYGVNGDKYVALGMIPVDGHMKVTQSYHFNPQAGNEYQGDTLSFDITIKGEQLPQGDNGMASVVLENKGGAPDWLIISGDQIKGTLNYQTTGDTFNYNFTGNVATDGINYTLLYAGSTGNYPAPGSLVLGSGLAIGGVVTLSGSQELHQGIANGKVWLVPSLTYDAGTHLFIGWDNTNNLYETGLVNYTDPNL